MADKMNVILGAVIVSIVIFAFAGTISDQSATAAATALANNQSVAATFWNLAPFGLALLGFLVLLGAAMYAYKHH